jgi:myo-inositol-1(or 4)-monophosphatase
MNNSDLFLAKKILKEQESKVYRDFMELENLQSSSNAVKFSTMTLDRLKRSFYDFFMEKRSECSIVIKNGKSNAVENARRSIYINCMTGIRNFTHSIPYFATVIAIKEKNKYAAAIVNNYATQEMFVVEAGAGAFLNTRRIRVSNKNELSDAMIGIKCSKDMEQNVRLISKLNTAFKINNCYVLDICQTAAGKLDGGIILDADDEELKIGELFIKEAGGLFEFLNQEKTDCVFSNSLIHDHLKKYVL